METISYCAASVVGVVLVVAGLSKLNIPVYRRAFVLQKLSIREPFDLWIARLLPVVELGLGTLCLWPAGIPGAYLAAFGLLFLFSAFIGLRLLRGLKTECGCFGETDHDEVDGILFTLRNGLLLVFSLVPLVWNPVIERVSQGFTLFLLAVCLVLSYAIFAFHWTLENRRKPKGAK